MCEPADLFVRHGVIELRGRRVMPAFELLARVQHEGLVEDAPRIKPCALPDLEVSRDQLHDKLAAALSPGPRGPHLRVVAAHDCGSRGRRLVSCASKSGAGAPIGDAVLRPTPCAQQAVGMNVVTR